MVSTTKFYLATCRVFDKSDADMTARVIKHKKKRQGRGWQTIEEELDLGRAVATLPDDAPVLIDCLTLWVSNLLHRQAENDVDENEVEQHINGLLSFCRTRSADTVLVSGEVGCGVIPENRLARRFRDLVGRCNQVAARSDDRVFMVNCGIPTQIKG